MKRLVIASAVVMAFMGAAQASITENVTMNFQSGGVFSGTVTFADDFSSYSGVNGTLTGGSNNYNSAITWVWDSSNRSSGSNNYSNWLMDGTSQSSYNHFIQFAYNYGAAPTLVFTSGVSTGNTDNFVNYNDAFVSGSIGQQVAAVPEPETYAMLMAGLGLIGGIARRRKQKQ